MNILYICTHNRCRSILCETITNQKAQGLIKACSAGSQPAGQVHPLTLTYLGKTGYDTAGLRSKSWEDLAGFVPDIIVTVCDQAVGESCPLWLGNTPKLHWGLCDPSKIVGDEEQKRLAFLATINEIEQRVDALSRVAKLGKPQQIAALQQLITASQNNA